ncbi:porin [Marinobacter xestospongiae]|uniref:porin n=1 Tax=Marinobacter xestospongiae TaxID=994319 RepID=UPI002004F5C4|nr:porin [Marinobacter xestospongiae]MCK7568317.1 porin [Marinobacter xestospongiae]
MKKTLIASAIAAATFSASALAADNMPTVYGNIQYALAHDNFDGGPSTVDHFDNGSTLGVKHSHEIAPGLEGFFKLELDGFDADDKTKGRGRVRLDEAYIGVKGDSFGKIWVGSDDSLYERKIDQIANFYEVATISIGGSYSTGEGDLIQYETPSFGGLTLGAAVQVNGDVENAEKSYPYQLAAAYEMGGVELALAMDSNDNHDGNAENTYGLRAAYGADSFTVSAEYQTRKDAYDVAGLMGVYTIGANQFALSYELATADDANDTERDTVTLQALHNVSDNMYVYFEGYLGGGDEVYSYTDSQGNTASTDERSIASVGAVYYF